jgi:hypothetical protein
MTDLSAFTALPPTAPVRVRWIEYPFCEHTRRGVQDCACRVCEGKPRPILWGGVGHEGVPLWSPVLNALMCVPENHAAEQGWAKDGTVLAFAHGLLLVAGDDGRVLTLATFNVRVLSSEAAP